MVQNRGCRSGLLCTRLKIYFVEQRVSSGLFIKVDFLFLSLLCYVSIEGFVRSIEWYREEPPSLSSVHILLSFIFNCRFNYTIFVEKKSGEAGGQLLVCFWMVVLLKLVRKVCCDLVDLVFSSAIGVDTNIFLVGERQTSLISLC
jgi:hypothetical protein